MAQMFMTRTREKEDVEYYWQQLKRREKIREEEERIRAQEVLKEEERLKLHREKQEETERKRRQRLQEAEEQSQRIEELRKEEERKMREQRRILRERFYEYDYGKRQEMDEENLKLMQQGEGFFFSRKTEREEKQKRKEQQEKLKKEEQYRPFRFFESNQEEQMTRDDFEKDRKKVIFDLEEEEKRTLLECLQELEEEEKKKKEEQDRLDLLEQQRKRQNEKESMKGILQTTHSVEIAPESQGKEDDLSSPVLVLPNEEVSQMQFNPVESLAMHTGPRMEKNDSENLEKSVKFKIENEKMCPLGEDCVHCTKEAEDQKMKSEIGRECNDNDLCTKKESQEKEVEKEGFFNKQELDLVLKSLDKQEEEHAVLQTFTLVLRLVQVRLGMKMRPVSEESSKTELLQALLANAEAVILKQDQDVERLQKALHLAKSSQEDFWTFVMIFVALLLILLRILGIKIRKMRLILLQILDTAKFLRDLE